MPLARIPECSMSANRRLKKELEEAALCSVMVYKFQGTSFRDFLVAPAARSQWLGAMMTKLVVRFSRENKVSHC